METTIKMNPIDAKTGGSLRDFFIDRLVDGFKPSNDGVFVKLVGRVRVFPTFQELLAIVTGGGYFENIALGIEIANSSANTEVPEGLPNRMKSVEGAPDEVRTWLEWQDATGYTRYNEGTKSIFRASINGGRLLNSNELRIIHNLSYANVIEWEDFQDRVKALNPPE